MIQQAKIKVLRSWLAGLAAMLILDLLWLGIVAAEFYAAQLGDLLGQPRWPVVAVFYLFYVSALVYLAVQPSATVKAAALAGAKLGAFAYTTYELTNWALLASWPASLVAVDIIWGILLTATVAAAAKWAE